MAESKSSEVSKILASPIKDMFVAIFFVSVGALMDINQIKNYIGIALVFIVISIIVKFGGTMLGGFLFRQAPLRQFVLHLRYLQGENFQLL